MPEYRERKKLEMTSPVGAITLNELVGLTEDSVLLVDGMGIVADRSRSPCRDRLDRVERYCREFWRVLPVLSEVESL